VSEYDDDGDDVAIDDGMEPESPSGEDPGVDDSDDDGDDDEVAAGGPAISVATPRGTRPISAKVRELAAALKAKNATKRGEHDLPDDDDADYDEAPSGAAIIAATETPAPEAPPPTPPPAPALDPEVVRMREEWTAKSSELEAREAKVRELEQSGDMAQLAEQYFERGAPAIVELLKKWEGVEGDALKDALADLVSDLTIHMGVEVPQEIKDRREITRTRKQVQRMRAQQERAAREASERAESAQDEQNRVRVKGILQQEITKPDHATVYPWLASEPNAGEIVFDVIDAAIKKDGTKLTWQEAAKRANDYLSTQSRAWFDKRRHLLVTASSQGAPASGSKQSTQGDPQVRRSQAPPATPPPGPPPTPPSEGKWDPEAHRRRVKAKHRAAFTRNDG
jgi:hypothetical protein